MELQKTFALIAMDGLEIGRDCLARQAMGRAMAAAEVLEPALSLMDRDFTAFGEAVQKAAVAARRLRGRERKQREKDMFAQLHREGLMDHAPALMGSDMLYAESGVELTAWRAEENARLRAVEELRAELLEPGEPTADAAALFWLLRESCMLSDLFSVREQQELEQKITGLAAEKESWRFLTETEFKNALTAFTLKAVKAKHSMFQNPYLEGVSLCFPFLERRTSIFIDMIVLGSTVGDRREAAADYLRGRGHRVEEVQNGTETLLKIDNSYYRVWPTTRTIRIPIQGVALVPVYR